MDNSTSRRPIPSLPATACPQCGAVAILQLGPGLPPHAFRANCAHCGAFLQWVSRYTPAERAARRQQALAERAILAMKGRPVPAAQLAYLTALGYQGADPTDRAEAHQLIAAHLARQKGGAA